MAARTLHIQLVRCVDPIFQPSCEVLPQILLVVALENVQILHAELLVFVPSQSQPCPSPFGQACRIQQIVDPFVVDLQEGHGDGECALSMRLDHLEET